MTRHVATIALLLALLTACGSSGSSDHDQIASIVQNEGTDPVSICKHLSQALINRLGGPAACARAAGSSPKDPSTHAKAITVRGNTATAVVVAKNGTSSVSLVKEKGSWKISTVR